MQSLASFLHLPAEGQGHVGPPHDRGMGPWPCSEVSHAAGFDQSLAALSAPDSPVYFSPGGADSHGMLTWRLVPSASSEWRRVGKGRQQRDGLFMGS